MDNPKTRIYNLEEKVAAEWQRARTQIREIPESVTIFNVGTRRAQVVYAPSFGEK